MPHPIATLLDDAAQTTRRIRRDARHLRDLARRGRIAAAVAAKVARAKLEAAAEKVADAIDTATERK